MKDKLKYAQAYPKYFALFGMILVSFNIVSNLMAGRILPFNFFGHEMILPGGIIIFPATFFILDVVTEFYGYKKGRRLVFYNLLCQGIFAMLIMIILSFDTKLTDGHEKAFQTALGTSGLIFIASFFATLFSDLMNCKLLAKWKIYTNGKHLWLRAFGSTAIGEIMFSCIWVMIFFYNKLLPDELLSIIFAQYLIKLLYEIFCLPLTYFFVFLLRKYENFEPERYENFSPSIEF